MTYLRRHVAICGALLVLVGLLTSGCASSPAKAIATSQNLYQHEVSVFDETCNAIMRIAPPKCTCQDLVKRLNTYEARLHDAAKALKAGGGLPLQMSDLKAAEKAVRDCQ